MYSDLFSIGPDTGLIVLLQPATALSFIAYILGVIAEDRGDNPIASMVSVTVTVTDVNQYAPVIVIDKATTNGGWGVTFVGGGDVFSIDEPTKYDFATDMNALPRNLSRLRNRQSTFDNEDVINGVMAGNSSSNQNPSLSPTGFVNPGEANSNNLDGTAPRTTSEVGQSSGTIQTGEDENQWNDYLELTEHGQPNASVAVVSVTDADGGLNGQFSCTLTGPAAGDFALVQLYESEFQILATRSFDKSVQKVCVSVRFYL